MAKRKRRRKSNKIFIKLILSLLTIFSVLYLFTKLPFFKVNSIKVTGVEKVLEEDIIRASGITNKDSYFSLDRGEVQERVTSIPLIEEARVVKNFPSGVTLEIKERSPAASVQYSNKYVLVDRFGYIIGENDNFLANLTQIKGLINGDQIRVGDRVFSYTSEEKLDFLSIIFNGDNIYKYKSIKFLDDKVDLTLKDDVVIAFGSYKNSEYKFNVIEQMLKSVGTGTGKTINMILMEEGPNPILVYE